MADRVEVSPECTIAGQLRFQAKACERLGSPLYAGLLHRAAEDVEVRGPTWDVLRGHECDPDSSALALRLMGATNRLALGGSEPALARVYQDSDTNPLTAWNTFVDVLERNTEALQQLVNLPVQTNEVGRSAALLFGFWTIAAETNLPLRLLEVGASAGLNLRWDRYRYRGGKFVWGPVDSPVEIGFELRGKMQLAPPQIEIVERLGCDFAPLDPTTPEGRLALLAYIWPDQRKRIERMEAAIDIAAEVPVSIDQDTAASWIEKKLEKESTNRATVLYHSIVMQYLDEQERVAFCSVVRDAASRATHDSPVAWLCMEPAQKWADVRLTTWPGGEHRHLARVGYHGTPIELL